MRASSRRRRGPFIWIALLSFCFAQLAVAAYVCPGEGNATRAEPVATVERDCHHSGVQFHDENNAQLCKAHCERSAQAKPSAPADPPDLASLVVPVLLPRAAPASVPQFFDSCRDLHGDPPLYLRNCVLRN